MTKMHSTLKWFGASMYKYVADMSKYTDSELMQMVFWCRANCKKEWYQTQHNQFLFQDADDAINYF